MDNTFEFACSSPIVYICSIYPMPLLAVEVLLFSAKRNSQVFKTEKLNYMRFKALLKR